MPCDGLAPETYECIKSAPLGDEHADELVAPVVLVPFVDESLLFLSVC